MRELIQFYTHLFKDLKDLSPMLYIPFHDPIRMLVSKQVNGQSLGGQQFKFFYYFFNYHPVFILLSYYAGPNLKHETHTRSFVHDGECGMHWC